MPNTNQNRDLNQELLSSEPIFKCLTNIKIYNKPSIHIANFHI